MLGAQIAFRLLKIFLMVEEEFGVKIELSLWRLLKSGIGNDVLTKYLKVTSFISSPLKTFHQKEIKGKVFFSLQIGKVELFCEAHSSIPFYNGKQFIKRKLILSFSDRE